MEMKPKSGLRVTMDHTFIMVVNPKKERGKERKEGRRDLPLKTSKEVIR